MNGSIYFNGIDQYLQINYNPSLNLYGDFTIEFFAKCDINNKSLGTIIASVGGNGINQIEISINYDYPGRNGFVIYNNFNNIYNGKKSINDNKWHHIAITRYGSYTDNIMIFIDGILDGKTTNSNMWDFGTAGCRIAGCISPGLLDDTYNGYLSNMRINNGNAIYITDFLPPINKLNNITNTVLLLKMDINNPFLDSSINNINILKSGNPLIINEPIVIESSSNIDIHNEPNNPDIHNETNSSDIHNEPNNPDIHNEPNNPDIVEKSNENNNIYIKILSIIFLICLFLFVLILFLNKYIKK